MGSGSTVRKFGGLKLGGGFAIGDETAFALHARRRGLWWAGLQHAGHGPGDGGLVDELKLALEDGLVVGVEADDEAGEHTRGRSRESC